LPVHYFINEVVEQQLNSTDLTKFCVVDGNYAKIRADWNQNIVVPGRIAGKLTLFPLDGSSSR